MDEQQDEGGSKKLISELITHINQLEQKLSSLDEAISESTDLQLVNKLDIINLKNEIEKLRLTSPSLDQEQMETLRQFSRMVDKTSVKELLELKKRMGELSKSVDSLGKQVAEFPTIDTLQAQAEGMRGQPWQPPGREIAELRSEIEKLKKSGHPRFQQLESALSELKRAPAARGDRHALSSLQESLKAAESRLSRQEAAIQHLQSGGLREAAKLQKSLELLSRKMEALAGDVEHYRQPAAAQDTRKAVSELSRKVEALAAREPAVSIGRVQQEVEAVSRKVAALAARPAQPAGKQKAAGSVQKSLEDISRKVSGLESLKARLDTQENSLRSFQKRLAPGGAGEKRQRLQASVGALSQEIAEVRKSLERQKASLPLLRQQLEREWRAGLQKERQETVSLILKELRRMMV